MITRLYANNFRCLVACEVKLGSFGLLCGPNGAGKSSVFDAIRILRDLASGDAYLGGEGEKDIRNLEFTKWLESRTQEFEFTVKEDNHQFDYHLQLQQKKDEIPRVIREWATCDHRELFIRDLDGVRFQRGDGTMTGFPLDWRRAALGAIQPIGSLREIEILQQAFANLMILQPNPRAMEADSKIETRSPAVDWRNLVSWYRFLAQEQEWTDALRDVLQSVWPDFRSFKLVDVGLNTKALQLRFDGVEPFFFGQLSDGERMLVGLYMVRTAMATNAARTVLIDEPDNFVGLPELQPWIVSIQELLDEEHQAILISHHPEVLDSTGEEHGTYLWRDNHSSPTRVGSLQIPEGMSAGEAIARGWVRG